MSETLYKVALEGIERNARYVSKGAIEVAAHVRALLFQRNFETKAEAAIIDAENSLVQALETVQLAKAAYQALPKEK